MLQLGFGGLALGRDLDERLRAIRDRTGDLVAAAAGVPAATSQAASTLVADERTSPIGLAARLLMLLVRRWLAERLFFRWSATWMRRIA